jgi:predicted negative regulator of RcsB-dependent stress response
MEKKIENNQSLIDKISSTILKKKKFFIIILLILLTTTSGFSFFYYYKENLNKKISDKYIEAGIYLSTKNLDKSKNIYKEIISSKNKFYALLSLNNIIENNLEKNNDEILKLFRIVESINLDKEKKNLVKLKKALYYLKQSKKIEANNLIRQIIEEDSIWKDTALEISK